MNERQRRRKKGKGGGGRGERKGKGQRIGKIRKKIESKIRKDTAVDRQDPLLSKMGTSCAYLYVEIIITQKG